MSTGRQLDSLSETADRYGVDIRTIRRWVSDGRLTAYRIGPRVLRFDPAEVDAALLKPVPSAAQGPKP